MRTALAERLGSLATVVGLGERVDIGAVLADLGARGARTVMVEGGRAVLTQLLASGLADELQLVVAPLFVGDGRAPRLVHDAVFPWTADHRARLLDVRPIGDVALLRYGLSERCRGDAPAPSAGTSPAADRGSTE